GSCTPLMVAALHPPAAGVPPLYPLPLALSRLSTIAGHLEPSTAMLQGWPAGTQQILIPSAWQQMPGMAIHGTGQPVIAESPGGSLLADGSSQSSANWRGRHGGQCDGTQQDAAQGCHVTSQTFNTGTANSRAQQSRVKRPKGRVAESRARPVSSTLHTSGDPSQPIIISDTPSPAVSIITIPSDTEDEDDTKVPPTSCSANQRANVISCVTVHDSQDSDSSTCSPLTPKRLPNSTDSSGQGSKSLAVVMPSLKIQPWEGVTSEQSSTTATKSKKTSAPHSSRSGLSGSERNPRTVTTKSQPLNLSQVAALPLCWESNAHAQTPEAPAEIFLHSASLPM
ncbi:homeodomain-interacting protein kinase 1 isoform X1, partial [Tachysurus ichikawai]